jgi:hypothetical protein
MILLGIPETSLSGLSTRTARSVLKSKLFPPLDMKIVMKPVTTTVKSIIFHTLRKYEPLCKAKPRAIILSEASMQNIARKYFSVDSFKIHMYTYYLSS